MQWTCSERLRTNGWRQVKLPLADTFINSNNPLIPKNMTTNSSYETVRMHQRRRNLRAAILALACAFVGAILLLNQQPQPIPAQSDWGQTRTFSAEMTTAQLNAVAESSRRAFEKLVHSDLSPYNAPAKSSRLRSSSDLRIELQNELDAANDPYGAFIRRDAYNTALVERSGRTIGVDLDLRYGQANNQGYFTAEPLTNSKSLVIPSGVEKGDILLAINGIAVSASGSEGYAVGNQLQAFLNNGGPLGSNVAVTIKRGDKVLELLLVRQVVRDEKEQGGAHVTDVFLPNTSRSSKRLPQAKTVGIDNLFNEQALPKLIAMLTEMKTAATPTRGIVLDLTDVKGSDGETALRVAALFLSHGVISQRLAATSGGNMELTSWEVVNGKVLRHTKLVTAKGGGAGAERVEVLDWQCNLFAGELVVMVGKDTSGGGEVIAAALQNDASRCIVTGESGTAGRGLAQTGFPIGDELVLCLSTDVYLKPNGESIEGQGITPDKIIPPGSPDLYFVGERLEERFKALPNPPPAAVDEPDPPETPETSGFSF